MSNQAVDKHQVLLLLLLEQPLGLLEQPLGLLEQPLGLDRSLFVAQYYEKSPETGLSLLHRDRHHLSPQNYDSRWS